MNLNFIIHHNLNNYIQNQQKLIVAVSGGADSICLAHLLHQNNYQIIIAHFNHNLRGAESELEAELSYKFAQKYNLPWEIKKWKNPPEKVSEEKSRQQRYHFLREIKDKYQAKFIVTGHHLDDQIETVLFNFIRGAGLRGLIGMKTKSADLLRPLLNIPKSEIIDYCQKNKLPYCTASDNYQLKYNRNILRLKVTPALLKINPEYKQTIIRNIEIFSDIQSYLSLNTRQWIKKNVKIDNAQKYTFALPSFQKLLPAPQREIIKSLFPSLLNIQFKQIEAVRNLIQSGKTGKFKKTGDLVWEIEYDQVLVWSNKNFSLPPKIPLTPVKINGVTNLPSQEIITTTLRSNHNLEITLAQKKIYLNYSKLPDNQLFVRSWQPGDKFQPSGLQGTQKLQDFFVNNKIPLRERNSIPIFTDKKNKILAISTLRVNNNS
jgi:tRNA(Ile)-lysidine synthase